MANSKHKLSVGLAMATLVVTLIFFASSILLMQSWFASLVAQAGLELESSARVFIIISMVLSIGAFITSWKQRSFLVAGLLAASGAIVMIHPLTTTLMHQHMSTEHLMNMVNGGPILGIISGLGILGLGVTKLVRTKMMTLQ